MLSVLVACYNEEINIIPTLKEIKKTCSHCKINKFEIIIINDKSTDRSKDIINEYIQNSDDKNIKLINNETNLGYGGSVKKGMKQAQYGNISTQNENQGDDINNNKAVIIENIDDETLMPNKVKKEELCFCLLEKNILKKKLALQCKI